MKASRWADPPKAAAAPAAVDSSTAVATTEPSPQESEVPAPASQDPTTAPEPELLEQPIAQEVASQTIPTFEPAMDEYSFQTREAEDDLFGDDVVPLEEPAPVEIVEAQPVESTPAVEEKPTPTAPAAHSRGRGGGRGRGRGRGGNHATTPKTTDETTAATADSTTPAPEGEKEAPVQTPKKEGAVRGDRSGTGGVKKPKLTEDELSERMAKINVKNASRAAAHARAEADAAQSAAREARAAEETAKRRQANVVRQKEERMNRTQMLGEREKNRQRKMNAVAGREWDVEKEEGFGGTGEESTRARRGAHGGVVGRPERTAEKERSVEGDIVEDVNSHAPSGPAFRGRGRGRGRGGRGGRGGPDGGAPQQQQRKPQAPPTSSDFPDLPPSSAPAKKDAETGAPPALSFPKKSNQGKDAEPKDPMTPVTPMDQVRSWADQVEREKGT